MKDVYLINYSVKGIKNLDELVSLSFYKKTISGNPETQEYNLKGIYGKNGSGKTAIITSVEVFRNLITNSSYLNNPVVQKNLNEIINKKQEKLYIESDFIVNTKDLVFQFRYSITLSKNTIGRYIISGEKLSYKKATSKSSSMSTVFEVIEGELVEIAGNETEEFIEIIRTKTTNLLSNSSLCSLFIEIILTDLVQKHEYYNSFSFISLCGLVLFGRELHVYIDEKDDHRDYYIYNSSEWVDSYGNDKIAMDEIISGSVDMDSDYICVISAHTNYVAENSYAKFEETVGRLYEFLHIFKSDLKGIQIDKKEDKEVLVCSLIMVYDSYRIHAEFESTGIKKLIKLFAYINEMAKGGIVFIDEFDSNLHDVYLCALLEYLMEYGEGQLCFTTHNVGPMDILRRNKKSIDFLSEDNKIYPWKTNGNYSPAKLYRNGMIEGSPFNVDSIDFIKAFTIQHEGA